MSGSKAPLLGGYDRQRGRNKETRDLFKWDWFWDWHMLRVYVRPWPSSSDCALGASPKWRWTKRQKDQKKNHHHNWGFHVFEWTINLKPFISHFLIIRFLRPCSAQPGFKCWPQKEQSVAKLKPSHSNLSSWHHSKEVLKGREKQWLHLYRELRTADALCRYAAAPF